MFGDSRCSCLFKNIMSHDRHMVVTWAQSTHAMQTGCANTAALLGQTSELAVVVRSLWEELDSEWVLLRP
jgi:hypothetical protein